MKSFIVFFPLVWSEFPGLCSLVHRVWDLDDAIFPEVLLEDYEEGVYGQPLVQTERDEHVLVFRNAGNDAGVVVVVPIGITYMHCTPSDSETTQAIAFDESGQNFSKHHCS